ncbi:MAG: GyrI-like domain-containing protein [Planctomycetota bacterium]
MTPLTSIVALLALPLTLALAAVAPAGSRADGPSAEELLALARARVIGARPNTTNAGTLRASGTMKVQQVPLEGKYTELHHAVGRGRIGWTFPGYGETVEGCDAGVHYEASPMGVDLRRGWRGAAALRMLALRRFVPWQTVYESAVLAGSETLEGERCHRIELAPKRPEDVGLDAPGADEARPKPDVWYVGADSLLVHRIDMQVSVPNRGAGTLALGFGDWRMVQGILVPYRTTRTMHGFTMVAQADIVELDVELEDAVFAAPEAVRKELGLPPAAAALTEPTWTVVELTVQPTVTVRTEVAPAEISRTLAALLPEVVRYVGEVGGEVAGPPFTRYHGEKDGKLDLEVGVPVRKGVEGRGRIQASTLPGGRAVTGDHVGEYHRLTETHAKLAAWLAEHGEVASGGVWEVYWTDPGLEPDRSKWRTQLVQPLNGRKAE